LSVPRNILQVCQILPWRGAGKINFLGHPAAAGVRRSIAIGVFRPQSKQIA
jgi:hypothetical protein